MRCEPGCTHPSHKDDERIKAALEMLLPTEDPPHLVGLAYEDAVYRFTRVGKLLQVADRLSMGHAAR